MSRTFHATKIEALLPFSTIMLRQPRANGVVTYLGKPLPPEGSEADMEQLRKVKLQSLIKQFGVFAVPIRHCGIEGIQNKLDLPSSRGSKAATVPAVQFHHLGGSGPHAQRFTAGIHPKLPAMV